MIEGKLHKITLEKDEVVKGKTNEIQKATHTNKMSCPQADCLVILGQCSYNSNWNEFLIHKIGMFIAYSTLRTLFI